jgi:hypothetical protein
MTLAQVNAALGEKFVSPSEPDEKGCFYIEPREFEGVALMIEEGKLVRIDVRTASVTTDAGIRIGDRASALKSRYGAQLKDEPHYYAGPEGRYLTLSLNKGIAIRFETSNENVKNWYIGYKKAVQYVEGCL